VVTVLVAGFEAALTGVLSVPEVVPIVRLIAGDELELFKGGGVNLAELVPGSVFEAEENEGEGAPPPPPPLPTLVPHFPQKFAPGLSGVLQEEQFVIVVLQTNTPE